MPKELYCWQQVANAIRDEVNPIGSVRVPKKDYVRFIHRMVVERCISRFRWRYLPDNLESYIVEEMLYWRGALVGFKNKDKAVFAQDDNLKNLGEGFYLLPFAISQGVNVYGLPNGVKPMPYGGDVPQSFNRLQTLELMVDATGQFNPKAQAVILYDRIPEFNGSNYDSRAAYNETIIMELAEIMARIRLDLITTTKKIAIKYRDVKQSDVLRAEAKEVFRTEDPFVLINGDWETEVLNLDIPSNVQDLFETFASYNSLLNESMGIPNNGVFEKKERKITGELEPMEASTKMVMQNGLDMRKKFIKNCLLLWPEDRWTVKDVNEDGEIEEKTVGWKDVEVVDVAAEEEEKQHDAEAEDIMLGEEQAPGPEGGKDNA